MESISKLRKDEDFDRSFKQIGGLTALSRVLGFLRDICLAQFIGAGAAADAFLVAFKLPNLFRRLTADGAMTNAFLPVFAHVRTTQGRPSALILAAEVQIILLLALSMIVVLAEIFMPSVIAFLAPGFVDDATLFDSTVALARITIPYLPMISLVALWAAVTNAHNRFFGGAAAPVILNICLIGGILTTPIFGHVTSQLGVEMGIFHLVWPLCLAVLLAGVAQMMLMQRMLARIDAKLSWHRPRLTDNGRKMWRGFLPAALGAGGLQLNFLIDMILASLVSVGAISWLYYSDRIVQLPLGIIGIALGTALLPTLSKLESEDDKTEVANRIGHSLQIALFFSIPATLAILLTADILIAGLFEYGAFSQIDSQQSAYALMAYGTGLVAFVVAKVFQPAFFASNRGGLVLKISLLSVGINIVGSVSLMTYLGHIGLALATAIASWVGVCVMAGLLMREGRLTKSAIGQALPILLCGFVMSVVLFGMKWALAGLILALPFGALLMLMVTVLAGLVSYFGVAYMLGVIPPFLFRLKRTARKG